MDLITSILCFVLILCISIKAIRSYSNPKSSKKLNIPPGPKPLPIIGNLFDLGNKPHQSLARLAKSYGPLMSLKLGQVTTIVVSSPALAKEVIMGQSQFFSNRSVPDAAHALGHCQYSMAWLPVSNYWRNLRRLSNSQLLAASVLDANMNLRHNKVEDLLREVQKSANAGQAMEVGKAAFLTTLNLLSTTFFSMDLLADPNSETVRQFKKDVVGIFEELGKSNMADHFPFLKKFDPQGIRRRTELYFQKMLDLFNRIIDERLQRLKEANGSVKENDILDNLINMMLAGEDNRGYDQVDRAAISHFLLDLFPAGTDTTSATLEWAMAELVKAPEIMAKARKELEQVIGKGNQVKESDINQLPYLQAIVKETFRLHPVAPLLVPRIADGDVELYGYSVPKDAKVLINIWAIGRDSNVWENFEEFIPERFLKSTIETGGRDFELIPFGAGRRICPGILLANRMLHLMLGSLLHSFDWKLEDGVETVNLDDKFGLTLQLAQPLRVVPIAIA
ncbi:hypothetical protein TIFTF001_018356 [Ficus carica]|uniref:Cytochrome P450 n=1 Tax=Ficus carica TaxID=3494 RepID=A0AA88AB87_FICCA|nr:hypothetical protein TIFTF001_018356 [Ficus carica]